jgi:hypothetical protein
MTRGATIVCGTRYVAPTPVAIESAVFEFVRLKMSKRGMIRRGPNLKVREMLISASVIVGSRSSPRWLSATFCDARVRLTPTADAAARVTE